jgi:hypothetical protein
MIARLVGWTLASAIYLASAGTAFASLMTFDVQWSGASLGNTATASGFITFDSAMLPGASDAPGDGDVPIPSPAVTDLGITITGATSGNGTFNLADFGEVAFWAPAPLNLSTELIGQDLGGGCIYGAPDGSCGDFNIFNNISGATSGAPYGVFYFSLATNDGQGDTMLVTSMTPRTVPEPPELALLGIGLIGFGVFQRKKKN